MAIFFTSSSKPGSEIAFIDRGLSDLPSMLKGLRADVEAVVLDPTRDAMSQIAAALRGRAGLDAIHILAHGQPGEVAFSSGALSLATLDEHADDLAVIGRALSEVGQ